MTTRTMSNVAPVARAASNDGDEPARKKWPRQRKEPRLGNSATTANSTRLAKAGLLPSLNPGPGTSKKSKAQANLLSASKVLYGVKRVKVLLLLQTQTGVMVPAFLLM